MLLLAAKEVEGASMDEPCMVKFVRVDAREIETAPLVIVLASPPVIFICIKKCLKYGPKFQ